jgi:predicted nucleic acid-binding protein
MLSMAANPPILLLDTNIWLDVYLPHRTGREDALALLGEARKRGASLAFASQAALDVYWRVIVDNKRWIRQSEPLTEDAARAIKRLAWDCVNEMQEIATAVPFDAGDFYQCAKFRDLHDDLEDDVIMSACVRSKANYLVTNDRKLLAHSPIDARTPRQMMELFHTGLAKGTPTIDQQDTSYWLYRWLESYE